MSYSNPFLILEQPCNEAIAWVVDQVGGVGLQVVRTFDLQAARHDPADCPCPHHGTDQCDCQMVVLLVYGDEYQPVSLIAHSYDGRTWFSLVDTPQQRADPHLERTIRQALPVEIIPPKGQVHWSHAS
ncbi:MAG: hypothetical protein A2Z27_03390 [candidate division Zixibacteria bacterium RBG_16_50_21]|nr:MAG: hypothetical protein A2Z27_03390 [candidate division Zixibacteria bacterium RBG_16_50_21]